MVTDPFDRARASLSDPSELIDQLAHPFVDFLPITGAAVSTLGPLLGSETLSASDDRAMRVDELQFDLGEGPCWDALAQHRPILEPDLARSPNRRWPAFSDAVQAEKIGALFAFPLLLGPLEIGAIDLYAANPTSLSDQEERQIVFLTEIVSRVVLRRALESIDMPAETNAHSRRQIHQATGMVLAQLDISAEDAQLLIQGRAFAEGRTMQAVSADIVERRLRFGRERTGIEDH